jgi:hypothetical protein
MSSARDTYDDAAQHAVETNQMLATMVAMTLALTFWGVAALNIGGPRAWYFAAIAAVLTLTAFALMRPSAAPARRPASDEEW